MRGISAKLDGARERVEQLWLALRVRRLAAGRRERFRVVAAALLLACQPAGMRRWLRVDLRLDGRRIPFAVGELSELLVLGEIFLDGEYSVDGLPRPDSILDLGSHIGASIVFFHLKFPEARIVGVEPDPEVFARLRWNTASLDRVEVLNAAATGESGPTTLFKSDSTWASALDRFWDSQKRESVVRGLTIDDVLAEAGMDPPDLLKFDIEGAEFDALPAFQGLGRVHAVVGELHSYAGPSDVAALLPGFKVIRQARQGVVEQVAAVRTADP